MISKKEFLKAIKNIQDYNIRVDAIRIIEPEFAIGISNIIQYLQDTAIRLLELNCELDPDIEYGTEISWWIYDTEFGRNKKMNTIWVGEKSYEINTAEDLYDFIKMDLKRRGKRL